MVFSGDRELVRVIRWMMADGRWKMEEESYLIDNWQLTIDSYFFLGASLIFFIIAVSILMSSAQSSLMDL